MGLQTLNQNDMKQPSVAAMLTAERIQELGCGASRTSIALLIQGLMDFQHEADRLVSSRDELSPMAAARLARLRADAKCSTP